MRNELKENKQGIDLVNIVNSHLNLGPTEENSACFMLKTIIMSHRVKLFAYKLVVARITVK